MFAKRHYEFLAAFIARERSITTGINWDADQTRTKTIDGLARLLASELARDNGRFNRTRFLEACDVKE